MGSDSYHWCDSSLSLSVWLPAPGRTPPSCGRWCRSPDWGTVGDSGPGGEWRDRPGPTPSLVLLSPVCYLLSDIWPRSSSLWQVLIFTEQLSSCLRAGLGRWLPPTHPLPLPPIVSRQPFKKILFRDMRQRDRETEIGFYFDVLLFICIFQWTDLRGGMRPDGSWKEWQFKFLQAILHTDTEPRQINWVQNFYWWIHWCFPWPPQHLNFHNDTISWIENLLKTWERPEL